MYFRIYPSKDGEYRWSLKADNHKIIADSSESYTTASGAREAVRRIKEGFKSEVEVKDETAKIPSLSTILSKPGRYKLKK